MSVRLWPMGAAMYVQNLFDSSGNWIAFRTEGFVYSPDDWIGWLPCAPPRNCAMMFEAVTAAQGAMSPVLSLSIQIT